MAFKYRIKAKVKLVSSGEEGVVVGRCDYEDSADSYYVRYKDATGKQIKCWWDESDIESVAKKLKVKQNKVVNISSEPILSSRAIHQYWWA